MVSLGMGVGVSCVVCVCGAGGVRAFVCFVCLWRLCWWQPWWWCWCVLWVPRCVCAVLVVCLVACPRLSRLGLAALCGCGAFFCGPSPVLAEGPGSGSPPLLAGVRWWWCVPLSPCVLSPLFPFAVLPCVLLPWTLLRGYLGCGGCAVGLGGWRGGGAGGRLGSLPLVIPLWGGRCLHSPTGCNSVVRAVHL